MIRSLNTRISSVSSRLKSAILKDSDVIPNLISPKEAPVTRATGDRTPTSRETLTVVRTPTSSRIPTGFRPPTVIRKPNTINPVIPIVSTDNITPEAMSNLAKAFADKLRQNKDAFSFLKPKVKESEPEEEKPIAIFPSKKPNRGRKRTVLKKAKYKHSTTGEIRQAMFVKYEPEDTLLGLGAVTYALEDTNGNTLSPMQWREYSGEATKTPPTTSPHPTTPVDIKDTGIIQPYLTTLSPAEMEPSIEEPNQVLSPDYVSSGSGYQTSAYQDDGSGGMSYNAGGEGYASADLLRPEAPSEAAMGGNLKKVVIVGAAIAIASVLFNGQGAGEAARKKPKKKNLSGVPKMVMS